MTILGTNKKTKKDEAAKAHKEQVKDLERFDANLLIYTDGSMIKEEGSHRRIVGWGVVGYIRGREVITRRGSLGDKAEVYDAELMGLAT
ncbi:hypothetical protein H0H87_001992, partial [Tephrocybe sp. NHM501043]